MEFYIAFDKDKNKEFLLYNKMVPNKDKTVYVNSSNELHIGKIGTFLLMFLNMDFTDIQECCSFIYLFCFKTFYNSKDYESLRLKDMYMNHEVKIETNPYELKLSKKSFRYDLASIRQ